MHDSTYFAAYFITNIFLLVSIHRFMHTFFEDQLHSSFPDFIDIQYRHQKMYFMRSFYLAVHADS